MQTSNFCSGEGEYLLSRCHYSEPQIDAPITFLGRCL